jgi:hypothetical protein
MKTGKGEAPVSIPLVLPAFSALFPGRLETLAAG